MRAAGSWSELDGVAGPSSGGVRGLGAGSAEAERSLEAGGRPSPFSFVRVTKRLGSAAGVGRAEFF